MAEILLLAVASAAWPLLLAVVLIALGSAHPKRLLAGFLAGGLVATVTVGLVIVHLIRTTSLQVGSENESRAALPLILGAAAIVYGLILRRRARHAGPAPEAPAAAGEPGRLVRWLDRSVPVVFLAGLIANLFPGAFPLLGLKDIAELDYGAAGTFAAVLVFYVIMFFPLEVPLIGFFVDPARTETSTRRFNDWLRRNKTMIGVDALLIVGIYLIVRGLIALAG
jgi:hypothetical protein